MPTEPKTKLTTASVESFLQKVKDKKRYQDCLSVMEMMKKATDEVPKMWGESLVGFGTYRYAYKTGKQGDWPIIAFSPRAKNLTIYIMPGFDRYNDLMKKLGKFKTGSSCLYLNKLEDVDLEVLKQLIKESVGFMREKYKS